MAYIHLLTQTISGMAPVYSFFERMKIREELAEKYPDLNEGEIEEVLEYKLGGGRERTGSKIFENIHRLQQEFILYANDRDKQLLCAAKLINYGELMRREYIAPGKYSFFSQFGGKDELRRSGGWGISNEIPEEVKLALDVDYIDGNFIDYVSEHVRHVFLGRDIYQKVKILRKYNLGTCEETTRSAIVVNYDEKLGIYLPAWAVAETLVHEAAHIEYFYKYADDPQRHEIDKAERYAYIKGMIYLDGLYQKICRDDEIDETTKMMVEYEYNFWRNKVNMLNLRLGKYPGPKKHGGHARSHNQ